MNNIYISNALSLLKKNQINFTFLGNPDILLTHPCSLEKASTGSICFYRGNDNQAINGFSSQSNCFLVSSNLEIKQLTLGNLIVTDNVDLAYCIVATLFQEDNEPYIHTTAIISPKAKIGTNVGIGKYSVIGENVVIGNNVCIGSNTVIDHSIIGSETTIGSGVIIGGETICHQKNQNGSWLKRPFFNLVEINSGAFIHDGVIISRGFLQNTTVGKNSIIGEGTWIGNGVNIGTSCLIAHRVVIAGSVQIGNFTKVWGNASIRDGVSVGINSVVGMGAVVIRNIPNNETWIGIPAKKI